MYASKTVQENYALGTPYRRLLVANDKVPQHMENTIIANKSKMGVQTSLYVHKERVERWNVSVEEKREQYARGASHLANKHRTQ